MEIVNAIKYTASLVFGQKKEAPKQVEDPKPEKKEVEIKTNKPKENDDEFDRTEFE